MEAEHHEAYYLAQENLDQLEEQCAAFTTPPASARASSGPIITDVAEMQPQDFIGLKVGTMTTPQYSRWCDLERPPLARKAPAEKPRPQPAVNENTIAQMIREETDRAMGMVADVIGAEVGQTEKALREEIAHLRTEVSVLRGELRRQAEDVQRHVILDVPRIALRGASHEH